VKLIRFFAWQSRSHPWVHLAMWKILVTCKTNKWLNFQSPSAWLYYVAIVVEIPLNEDSDCKVQPGITHSPSLSLQEVGNYEEHCNWNWNKLGSWCAMYLLLQLLLIYFRHLDKYYHYKSLLWRVSLWFTCEQKIVKRFEISFILTALGEPAPTLVPWQKPDPVPVWF
jgi:hypothetical protein